VVESSLHHSLLHSVTVHGIFLNTEISQNSVAAPIRCGGIFNNEFDANLLVSPTVKNFENRLGFVEVTGKSLVSSFYTHSV